MSLIRFLLISFLVSVSINALAQEIDSVGHVRSASNLTLSYNSSLIYPGLRFGIELPIKRVNVRKLRSSGRIRQYTKERFITPMLSWYHHPTYHDNVYLTAGWTIRRTHSGGFMKELTPAIGLSRTFLGGTTYKVSNEGNVEIERLAGYYYYLLSISGGLGYDFAIKKHKPVAVFSRLSLMALFPYNSTILLRPTLELGIIYKPSHFLRLPLKTRTQ